MHHSLKTNCTRFKQYAYPLNHPWKQSTRVCFKTKSSTKQTLILRAYTSNNTPTPKQCVLTRMRRIKSPRMYNWISRNMASKFPLKHVRKKKYPNSNWPQYLKMRSDHARTPFWRTNGRVVKYAWELLTQKHQFMVKKLNFSYPNTQMKIPVSANQPSIKYQHKIKSNKNISKTWPSCHRTLKCGRFSKPFHFPYTSIVNTILHYLKTFPEHHTKFTQYVS